MIGQLFESRKIWNYENKVENCQYDAFKRDPLYSNAKNSILFELLIFTKHFHPTVSLYANTLVMNKNVEMPADATNYDPLTNHTISRFLDRFCYKAPKSIKRMYESASSIIRPKLKRNSIIDGVRNDDYLPNESEALNINLPDEEFFKTYFNNKAVKGHGKVEKAEIKSLLDVDDIEEDEIFNAMSRSMKTEEMNLDGGGDDDDLIDDEIFDIEDEDGSGDDGFEDDGSEDDCSEDDDEILNEEQMAEMDFGNEDDEMAKWSSNPTSKVPIKLTIGRYD
jgi:ribosome biogenesis protein MAK21